jgi:hypothetical protein
MAQANPARVRTRDVERIKRRIEHWRHTRLKRKPMPEQLWVAAAAVARKHGVNYVAKELRLNHTSLQKRVRAGKPDGGGQSFVEVDLGVTGGAATQTVIELTDETGAQVTIKTVGDHGVDMMSLAHEFWGRGK